MHSAYRAAHLETCKGIKRDIPISEGPQALRREIANPRNYVALSSKRIKESGTVIIPFDGYKVPNFVRSGNARLLVQALPQVSRYFLCVWKGGASL